MMMIFGYNAVQQEGVDDDDNNKLLYPLSSSDGQQSSCLVNNNKVCNTTIGHTTAHGCCCGARRRKSAIIATGLSGLLLVIALCCLMVIRIVMEGRRVPLLIEQEHHETVVPVTIKSNVLQLTSTTNSACNDREQDSNSLLWMQRQRQLQNNYCEDNDNGDDSSSSRYISETLKLVNELPFVSLFAMNATAGQRRFDASSIVIVGEYAYTVYDKSFTIGKISIPHLAPFNTINTQIGLVPTTTTRGEEAADSEFEAILYNNETGNFFVIQESIQNNNTGTFHAMFVELAMNTNETDYTVVETCPSEFQFNQSHGISGAVTLRTTNTSSLVVLALCSVNHCDDNGDKDDKGNGRIIVMMYMPATDAASSCQWKTIRILNIPAMANFLDYSDLDITANGRVVITSREESQVWIGQLLGQQEEPGGGSYWQVNDIVFDENVGDVYNFPRGSINECSKVYCSVDGVQWLNDDMILVVSDKMKDSDDFWCLDKDQSIHIFSLPTTTAFFEEDNNNNTQSSTTQTTQPTQTPKNTQTSSASISCRSLSNLPTTLLALYFGTLYIYS